ncbi:hypothetical protein TNCV_1602011 [Trichonephila clavipes]|nr:hypothetical protein TNCV_1602011 [Trichonephila clavipes]
MEPHKPKKSLPVQDTSDEDMIVYDMEEEEGLLKNHSYLGETKNHRYFLSEEYWQNEGEKHEQYSHTLTSTRDGSSLR